MILMIECRKKVIIDYIQVLIVLLGKKHISQSERFAFL
jgi:hypothetical protein